MIPLEHASDNTVPLVILSWFSKAAIRLQEPWADDDDYSFEIGPDGTMDKELEMVIRYAGLSSKLPSRGHRISDLSMRHCVHALPLQGMHSQISSSEFKITALAVCR